jgi:amino acid adenylation domain-containing protein
MDSQVKIRGFRIELDEVNSVILSHKSVSRSTVTVVSGEDGGSELTAFVVCDAELTSTIIIDHIRTRLPEYMIPGRVLIVPEFPITSNGKVDVKKMIHSFLNKPSAPVAEPGTSIENTIMQVWRGQFPHEILGIDTDYFSCGGDSIRAIRLCNLLAESLGTRIPVAEIYANPTIRKQANYFQKIKSATTDTQKASSQEIEKLQLDFLTANGLSVLKNDWEDAYPLSEIQKGMFFHQLRSNDGTYIDQFVYQFALEGFDKKIFAAALHHLVQSHPMMRTTVDLHSDPPFQIVHRHIDIDKKIRFLDTTDLDKSASQKFIEKDIETDLLAVSDSSTPGLWRMSGYQMSDSTQLLVLTFHHGIMDGWSNSAFMSDLHSAYQSMKNKKPFHVKINGSYKDHVREELAIINDEKSHQYWKHYLRGFQRVRLPLTKSTVTRSRAAQNYSIGIPDAMKQGIEKLSASLSIHPQFLYFTAFIKLIQLTTNTNDITVGYVLHSRPEVADADRIIGCFLNTVPYRVTLSPSDNLNDILRKTKEIMTDLRRFGKYPLSKIRTVDIGESSKQNPFFDIIFNYTSFHVYEGLESELDFRTATISNKYSTNTAFDFSLSDNSDQTHAVIGSWANYNGNDLQRIGDYYLRILDALISGNYNAQNQDLIGEDELQRLMIDFNDTSVPYSFESITTLIANSAGKFRKHIALVDADASYTYEELMQRGDELASFMTHRGGVAKGDVVAVMSGRSALTIVAMVAVWKCGAIYLPIDAFATLERIKLMLSLSLPKLVLYDTDDVPESSSDFRFVYLKDRHQPTQKNNAHVDLHPHDIAYIIFTSGSTGTPKAVPVDHAALLNLCFWHNDVFEVNEHSRATQYANIGFDAAIWEVVPYLIQGATIYMVTEGTKKNVPMLGQFLGVNRISHTFLPTPVLDSYSELADLLPPMIKILTGGDALKSYNGVHELYNNYGLTESAVVSTSVRIRAGDTISIGRPIHNTTLYILSENGQILPQDVIGEIYIGGSGLTNSLPGSAGFEGKFITNPYGKGLLFRTGDLGRLMSDGRVAFYGRADFQIKLHGLRFEPEEIEGLLSKMEVSSVAAKLIVDAHGNKRLVAFYTSPQPIKASTFRTFLGQYLPASLIPTSYVQLEKMPITDNGKIDRTKLHFDADVHHQEKKDDKIADEIASIMSTILKQPTVRHAENFFEAGGNSLKSLKLMEQLERQFELRFNISDIYNCATPADLAELVRERSAPEEKKIAIREFEM